MSLGLTGSQTLGPFFNSALMRDGENDLTRLRKKGPQAEGVVVEIQGQLRDCDGAPCPSALVEIWQADAAGRYGAESDANFSGFGRFLTDGEGRYSFTTIVPGAVPGKGNTWQAPHISMSVYASGLLKRVATRIYFPDETTNDDDPVLSGIADETVRSTLVARRIAEGSFEFDVVLQGEGETAFFEL